MLLLLLTNLMYSDRVWLAERGLYFGGRLYAWDGFERVAWTDDGRAFALSKEGPVAAPALGSRAGSRRVARGSGAGLAAGDARSHPDSLARFHHRAVEHAGVAQEFLGRGQE